MPAGAPSKYKKEYDKKAYKLCILGATDKEIADFFEVDQGTIYNWQKKNQSFRKAFIDGKIKADANVANSLYKRAIGYNHKDTKVFNNNGEIITHEVIKHYPPDTASAFIWLKNRRPNEWRDKQHVEHSIAGEAIKKVNSLFFEDEDKQDDN